MLGARNLHRLQAHTSYKDEYLTTLEEIFEDEEYKGKPMPYLWDFGDNWEHKLFVLGKEEAEKREARVACVEGKGAYKDSYVDRQ